MRQSMPAVSQGALCAGLLLSLVMVSGCATVKTHPDFAKRHEQMRSIAVMPPDVEAYEVTFNAGPKPLADLKTMVETSSSGHIAEAFKSKGYEVVSIAVTPDRLEQEPQLKEAWFDIQTLYKQAVKDIAENKKKTFTYEVGSGPNYFADKESVNAIVLTRQVGTKLSQGKISAQVVQNVASIATSLLVGVSAGGNAQPWRTLDTEIAVIDAESGDILWYNLLRCTDDYTKPENDKIIKAHIQNILALFPHSKFKKKEVKPEAAAVVTTPPTAQKNNFAASKPPLGISR